MWFSNIRKIISSHNRICKFWNNFDQFSKTRFVILFYLAKYGQNYEKIITNFGHEMWSL